MRFRAVLFDLDGTLLDTLGDLAASMNAALSSLGLPAHPIESYRLFVGDGVETLVERAIPEGLRGDGGLRERCAALMRSEYAKRWGDTTRPYAGVPELLDRLSAMGAVMCILSNKPHDFTVDIVERFFSGTEFVAVIGKRSGVPKKPDPAAALEICRTAGVTASEFAYLGDTNTDMLTARAAGMFPVGALWGFRTEGELRQAGAARLIRSPLDLIPIMKG